MSNHEHMCHCGISHKEPHKIATNGCQRHMIDEPDLKLTTMTTYIQQRGYYKHSCGCWSCWDSSYNSLE